MQRTIKKTAIILVGMLTIALVSGNILMAQESEVGGLITDADLAFIQASPRSISTPVAAADQTQPVGLITAADYTFVAQTYAKPSVNRPVVSALESSGIITAADYKFLTTGQVVDVFSAYNDFADSLAGHLAK